MAETVEERLARRFHEVYEQLAPKHGWTTQEASRVPWDQVPAHNRALMMDTIGELLAGGMIEVGVSLSAPQEDAVPPELDQREPLVSPGLWEHRPTVVHAEQYTAQSRDQVLRWLQAAGADYWFDRANNLRLMTPQGSKPVAYGDWVTRGVIGEWYPISDAVFIRAYRPRDGEVPGAAVTGQ